MYRELAFHGVYVPTMTLLFFVAAVLAWALGALFKGVDLYRYVWHPALLRLSVFTCIFGALALTVYR